MKQKPAVKKKAFSGKLQRQKKSTGMPTAKKLVCKYCGVTTDKDGKPFESLTDPSRHVRVDCAEYKKYKEKKRVAEGTKEGSPASPFRGEPDADGILRHILDTFPGLPLDAVKEVMSWADLAGAPLHPAQVRDLLAKMQKVTNPTADIVAQKYALALQKAQMENKLTGPNPFISPGFSQGPTMGGGPYPYTYQPGFTFGYPPQNPYGGYPPQNPPPQNWQNPPPQYYGQPPPYGQPVDVEGAIRRAVEEARRQFDEKLTRIEEKVAAPSHRQVSEDGEEEI